MKCLIGETTVHYVVIGSGQPVLMLHGFSLDHRVMTGCLEPVFVQRSENWKRIYVDFPGMGKSVGTNHIHSSDDMLDVMLEFIDQVIGNTPFLIAGLSYGGYIARGIIAKRSEQVIGVAFISPMIIPDSHKRTLPDHHVIYRDENFLTQLSEAEREVFCTYAVVQDRENWKRFQTEILDGSTLAIPSFLEKIRKQYAFSDDVDVLITAFSKPSLFLMGRQDGMTGFQDAWHVFQRFTRATFAVLDRAGHNLQLEQPRLFQEMVDEWLDRTVESQS
ncbi:alpha/beta hydrolase [Hazenella sp. IB182353]|uniref:alpha/beta fold hydrolase n=1 Tax=Polycladospora coralii TaxID=2771432 RepID=UPI0017461977|nr:alpha/beta hydrolase [Polycladospora coralii]MBS7528996.1 alpha/beta hydrolase [Polycladospora coralii]